MNESRHPVDDLFKNAADNYSVRPSAYSWDRLDEGLTAAAAGKRIAWLRWAAAIVAIISSFWFGYYLANQNTELPIAAQDKIIETPVNDIQNNDQTLITSNDQQKSKDNNSPVFTKQNPSTKTVKKSRKLIKQLLNKKSEEKVLYANRISGIQNLKAKKALLLIKRNVSENKIISEDPAFALLVEPQAPDNNSKNNEQEYVYEGPSNKSNKWAFGGAASPIYAYRSTQAENKEIPMLAFAEQHLDQSETPIISYSGGMAASYKLSDKFSLSSGFYYSQYGQKSTNFLISDYSSKNVLLNTSAGEVQLEENHDPSGKFIQAANTSESVLTQQFNYMEIPLTISYNLFDFQKLNIRLLGGFQTGYMVSNSARVNLSNNDLLYSGQTLDLNRYSIGSNLGIGFDYEILPKVSFSLIPNLNLGMKNINKQSGINHFPFAIKIFSGINFYID